MTVACSKSNATVKILNELASYDMERSTRRQWIEAEREDRRIQHLLRLGSRLERTSEALRGLYKSVSNWERDNTVSDIRQIHGRSFTRGDSIADKFASEWMPILGISHRSVPLASLEQAFTDFVSIPVVSRVTPVENERLMSPIAETEVLAAITVISRHKAPGTDGLNNDFYKDTMSVMVPALTAVANNIMDGADPPASFLEALIIPLRKTGDSDDAMDYRPNSLLQTSYKVFAKVIATRLQLILPHVIGDTQHGFIRGRQMQKAVVMMLAQLLRGYGLTSHHSSSRL